MCYDRKKRKEETIMAGNYTWNDIYRMERELEQLKMELRARPDRADTIETEIRNLQYEISDAKRKVR